MYIIYKMVYFLRFKRCSIKQNVVIATTIDEQKNEFTEKLVMNCTPLARVLCACALSLASVAANAAVVYWTPTDGDTNYSYTLTTGYSLAIFDVDDFDGSKVNPLLINNGLNTGVDTIDILPSGSDYTATSVASSLSITLFNDNQFVVTTTDNAGNWFEPVTWSEAAPNTNIYNITFANGAVLQIDAIASNPPAEIPVPAAVWLFGSGLLGLIGVARRNKA
jgi:hypothetical protein